MSKNKIDKEILGPEVYENWKKWQKNHAEWIVCEYPLFTDAHVTGELSDLPGPYQLINMVPESLGECLAPTVILRIAQPPGLYEIPLMTKTDDYRFHGGTIVDEVAALLSLELGIRFKAGKMIRMFHPSDDPKGRPIAFEMLQDSVAPRYIPRRVVPTARGKHSINQADLWLRLLELAPMDAVALVRASRLYQDALWICESQPALSWLFLVSSVETAANHWDKKKEKPEETLRVLCPGVVDELNEVGGKALVGKIAVKIAPYMGATKKFVDFIMYYLPDPPKNRPPNYAQFNWDDSNMKRSLKKIYGHRSKALHNGTPFPLPMCDAPMKYGNSFAEKPMGLAASARGGVWVADDIPILLCTFEYIARNALLKWWRSMLEKQSHISA